MNPGADGNHDAINDRSKRENGGPNTRSCVRDNDWRKNVQERRLYRDAAPQYDHDHRKRLQLARIVRGRS
jgi:hypothetical protein